MDETEIIKKKAELLDLIRLKDQTVAQVQRIEQAIQRGHQELVAMETTGEGNAQTAAKPAVVKTAKSK